MNPDVDKKWEEFLNPEILRPRVVRAALYIVAFDMLKWTIVERLRSFVDGGSGAPDESPSPQYAAVLKRNRSPVYASLDWLIENGAIADEDLLTFERVKRCRNEMAHNMLEALSDGLPLDFDTTFAALLALLRKIEVWWIVEVDVPVNPQCDGQTIDPTSILPGQIAGLQLLHEVVLGPPEQGRYYYEEFMKRVRGTSS